MPRKILLPAGTICFLLLILSFSWGCSPEKKTEIQFRQGADRQGSLQERKRDRPAQPSTQPAEPSAELGTEASRYAETKNRSLDNPTIGLATGGAKTVEDFRARLETITGKPILSDAELLAKAEKGDAEAQAELGKNAFSQGNLEDGVKWCQKAAEQGHRGSQYGLGVCYIKGYGVEKNFEQAVKWFALAAAQGHIDAQASLARRYAEGEGVPQDKVEAYKWYDVAYRAGRSNGKNSLDRLAATMTQQEIAEGKRRSAGFVVNSK